MVRKDAYQLFVSLNADRMAYVGCVEACKKWHMNGTTAHISIQLCVIDGA